MVIAIHSGARVSRHDKDDDAAAVSAMYRLPVLLIKDGLWANSKTRPHSPDGLERRRVRSVDPEGPGRMRSS